MALPTILKSLHGRAFGLGPKNELIVNNEQPDGTGMAGAQALVLNRVRRSITQAEMQALFTTPVELVAAIAGFRHIPVLCFVHYDENGTAFGTTATLHLVSSGTTKISGDAPCGLAQFLGGTVIFDCGGESPANQTGNIRLTANANSSAGADDTVVADLYYITVPDVPEV